MATVDEVETGARAIYRAHWSSLPEKIKDIFRRSAKRAIEAVDDQRAKSGTETL